MARSLEARRAPAGRRGRRHPARRLVARVLRRRQLRALRGPPRNVPAGQRPRTRMLARAADGRSDERSAWRDASPHDRLREDEMAVVPFTSASTRAFRRSPSGCSADARRCGQRPRWTSEVTERALAARARGDRQPRTCRSDLPAVRANRPRHVPRPSGAQLDRQHHRRIRGADGEGRDPQSPRATAGDLLPRHQRLHAAHPGARRRRGRRPGHDDGAARAA